MAQSITVTIRGKPVKVVGSSKADFARALLNSGYTVAEISRAVPMAYSQVHSIAKSVTPAVTVKSQGDPRYGKTTFEPTQGVKGTRAALKAAKAIDADVSRILSRERANERTGARPGPRLNPRVGKLRTGGLPQDIEVGECANCGFDLVVRKGPYGFMFTHVNATAEEYLATIQFCQAVPKRLLK